MRSARRLPPTPEPFNPAWTDEELDAALERYRKGWEACAEDAKRETRRLEVFLLVILGVGAIMIANVAYILVTAS